MVFARRLVCAALALYLSGCGIGEKAGDPVLRQAIAQKFIVDFRYYCPEMPAGEKCEEPVTELQPELADLIAEYGAGGVVLFADNLVDIEQIVRLNHDLQAAARRSPGQVPLLLSIDQEGGRVVRLPRALATSFTGNMAIGATYENSGTRWASKSAAIIGAELKTLGFNVNFAPTMDVNSNLDNPVINTRSFGEDPQVVGDLGVAAVRAYHAAGIATAVKHFPGHGDTSVDSHTGLPLVERSREEADALDLAPFRQVFAEAPPALVMTAHIQYPALGSDMLKGRDGEKMLAPATLSRTILTDLLREELGYDGVVVSDALDMVGISGYFDVEDAVIKSFDAGADIALMPIKIRSRADLQKWSKLIDRVEIALNRGELDEEEFWTSVQRVKRLKQNFIDQHWNVMEVETKLAVAKEKLGNRDHRAAEFALARESLTQVTGAEQLSLPLSPEDARHIHLLLPETSMAGVFEAEIARLQQAGEISGVRVTVSSPDEHDPAQLDGALLEASTVIAVTLYPFDGWREIGGPEPTAARMVNAEGYLERLESLLAASRAAGNKNILVNMRTPLENGAFTGVVDAMIDTYDYKAFEGEDGALTGPVYRALLRSLLLDGRLQGRSPVGLRQPSAVAVSGAGQGDGA